MQIFVIGVHLTVLLSSLINQGYTQVYVIIFTQHPPVIDKLKKKKKNQSAAKQVCYINLVKYASFLFSFLEYITIEMPD